jgi:branched-chain amino acid transport system permease protein
MSRAGALLLAALVLLALAPLAGAPFYLQLLTKVMILGIFAMSLDLLVGHTGLVSFGHAAYFGLGGYALAWLAPGYEAANLWLTLPAAMAAGAAYALVAGALALRTRGVYFIMATLAFAQLAYFVLHDTPLGGGSDGRYIHVKPQAAIGGWLPFDLESASHFYWFALALLAATYVFLRRVTDSPFGRALAGIRVNEQRMEALGYAAFRYKLGAFVLAGALAGLAGYLSALQFGFVNPELLSWHQSGAVLLMVILGGKGTLHGPIAGAFVFVLLQEVLSNPAWLGDWARHWQLTLGLAIILVALFLPRGLAGLRWTRTT